jgi:ABC-type transport system involved in multi-copper enzyme maturation permease subunit
MNGLVAAELLKVRATRSTWVLAAVAVVFCLAWASVDVLVFPFDRPADQQVEDAYSMAQQGYLLVLILGVLVAAGDYRHQTITWAMLVTPRRGRVITGKLLACAVVGLVVGLVAAAATVGLTAVLLAVSGRPVMTAGVPLVLLGSVLGTTLWCVFGAALGALLRNQVLAVGVAFVWFLYAEWFLVMLLPEVGRWTPTGAAKAVAGWHRTGMPVAGELLPMWAGGAVFLGYALVAAAVAGAVSVRRDIT